MKIRQFIWGFKFTKICKNKEYEKKLLTACTLSCLQYISKATLIIDRLKMSYKGGHKLIIQKFDCD